MLEEHARNRFREHPQTHRRGQGEEHDGVLRVVMQATHLSQAPSMSEGLQRRKHGVRRRDGDERQGELLDTVRVVERRRPTVAQESLSHQPVDHHVDLVDGGAERQGSAGLQDREGAAVGGFDARCLGGGCGVSAQEPVRGQGGHVDHQLHDSTEQHAPSQQAGYVPLGREDLHLAALGARLPPELHPHPQQSGDPNHVHDRGSRVRNRVVTPYEQGTSRKRRDADEHHEGHQPHGQVPNRTRVLSQPRPTRERHAIGQNRDDPHRQRADDEQDQGRQRDGAQEQLFARFVALVSINLGDGRLQGSGERSFAEQTTE